MGIILFLASVFYIIYKISEEKSWDNGKANNVDYKQMIIDRNTGNGLSRAETKRRYRSGYYNKEK